MLTRLGIPCRIVTSEGMNHGWNLVQLDGQWYHVDVTWDDPTPDSYGQVLHDFFLLTDEEVAAGDEPHYGWETDITCTDTRFSDAWWRDTVGQICYADSKTAYLIRTKDWNNYLYARDEASGEETRLYRDKKSYVNLGEGEYCYSHGSLSLWNGRLYYSTQDELISMELSGKDQRREYRHNTRTEHTYLFACHVDRDTMYATFCDHDGNKSAATLALDPTGYHTHSFTETVEPPACLEPGQTLSVCECGLSAMSLPTAPTGHSFTIVEKRDASIFSAGWATLECSACGEESKEDYPQIPFVDWLGDNYAFVAVAAALLFSLLKLLKKKPHST
jgi:hypothetical protein